MRIIPKIFVGAIFAALCAPALAGGLDGPEIADYRVWRANRCYKPPPPPIQVSDPLTYNLAVDRFNRYFEQMKAFMECAGAEANTDYEVMRKILDIGLERARSDALNDLERTRAAIERYRGAYSGPSLNAKVPPNR
jgi:hypothetical protein